MDVIKFLFFLLTFIALEFNKLMRMQVLKLWYNVLIFIFTPYTWLKRSFKMKFILNKLLYHVVLALFANAFFVFCAFYAKWPQIWRRSVWLNNRLHPVLPNMQQNTRKGENNQIDLIIPVILITNVIFLHEKVTCQYFSKG